MSQSIDVPFRRATGFALSHAGNPARHLCQVAVPLRQHLAATIAIAMLALASAVPAAAGPGAAGHSHDHGAAFSAGEPGNPKKPARIVLVNMQEGSGKMMFVPNRIEIKRGEQVRFMLSNSGELEHEFVLATAEENLKHAEQMKKNPDMEHDDPNARRLKPKKREEIVWRFSKAGQFEFGCLIPGHREAGMTGTIIVK